MPKIYLARHGQDEDNAKGILNGRRDLPLTAVGLGQARVLAEKIKGLDLRIATVFSSPLQRAYRTAAVVADALGAAQPEKLDLLIERDFGIMTGEPAADIERRCSPDIIKSDPITYFLSPEGAETFPDLLIRSQKILDWLQGNCPDKDVLLVTHGDLGKMIYARFYDLDWRDVLTQFHFGNSEVLLLDKDSRPEERHLHRAKQYNS